MKPVRAQHTFPLRRTGRYLRLAAAVFLFNAGFSIYQFLFNFYLAAEGLREGRMGALASAQVLGGLAGALPVGRAACRWGASRTMAVLLLATGVLFAVRLVVSPFFLQWTLAALSGVALCGWTVLIFPLIAQLVPDCERDGGFKILFGLATIAGCVGAAVGGWFPGQWMRAVASATVAEAERTGLLAGAALVLAAAFLVPGSRRTAAVEPLRPFHPSARQGGLLAASLLWAFVLGALNPFAGIYFHAQFGMGVRAVGSYFFVVQAAAGLMLVLAGAGLERRVDAGRMLVAIEVLAAASFALMAARMVWLAECAYLVFMLVQQMSQPTLQSLLLAGAPAGERNQLAAWNTMLIALAQSLAAQGFGWIWGWWGYAAALPGLAVATLAVAAATGTVLARTKAAAQVPSTLQS